ncbi:MAG TPA: thermonuclease family protein [Acidimicrobiales bacterium]|nr:thermonuclease family protein [Acidimicrobiales bacterium]
MPTDGDLPGFEPNASVVRIVDGDTIIADLDGRDERIRLIGIDTPESVIPDTPPECFGPEASDHLESLIPPGTDILIERDAEARDKFDRLLGYIYRSSDGQFVNLQMATDGFAYPLTIAPNDTHAGTISDAVALARRDDLGLWAVC